MATLDLPWVARTKALEFINRQPTAGTIPFLVGPLGSGKSTVALQWMSHHGGTFQYISVRSVADIPDEWIDQPDEFGEAMVALFNCCAAPIDENSSWKIEENLIRVVELSRTAPRQFVLDDVEMLPRIGMNTLQPLLAPNLSTFRFRHAMLISRTMDSYVLRNLQSLGNLRIVLPSTLQFDAEESREAHRLGIFGSANIEEVLDARESASGWLTGMLASVGYQGGKTIGPRNFESFLLNEMMMLHSRSMLHVVMTSAFLPTLSVSLLEDLFDHVGLPHWLITSAMSALPRREIDEHQSTFKIVAVMRDVLQRLCPITTDADLIDDLMAVAMAWYVRHDHLDTAVTLAKNHGLEQSLLTVLKPPCVRHAEAENWTEILRILADLPREMLIQHSGLSFWYFHGLMENERWPELRELYEQAKSAWSTSADPTTRARLHLMQSWTAYAFDKGMDARDHAEAAYGTFPENAHRARMWSAGSAAIAESMLGNTEGARQWSARANLQQTFIAPSSRWWHNSAGVIRYSWLANHGQLQDTYDLCTRQIRSLIDLDPALSTRYLILKAQIDMERLRFDSAEALLEEAAHVSDGKYAHQHHLRVTRSNFARARGDLDLAWEILSSTAAANNMRYDQYVRENMLRAMLALDMDDVRTADLFWGGVPDMDNSWIKNFGDAHPQLVRARILQAKGYLDDGLTMAQSVVQVSKKWKQAHPGVTAQATLAHMFHLNGDSTLRDHAIQEAQALAGSSGMQLAFVVAGKDVRKLNTQFSRAPAENETSDALQPGRLTDRELEILTLVAEQQSNKAIAETLFLSVSTVKNHLSNVFEKLGTNNRRTAVRHAKSLGLLTD